MGRLRTRRTVDRPLRTWQVLFGVCYVMGAGLTGGRPDGGRRRRPVASSAMPAMSATPPTMSRTSGQVFPYLLIWLLSCLASLTASLTLDDVVRVVTSYTGMPGT